MVLNNEKEIIGVIIILAVLLVGCSGKSTDEPTIEPAAGGADKIVKSPAEYTNSRGLAFLRQDLWDPAELERVRASWSSGDPQTVEELAEHLRAVTLKYGTTYIQVEPDLEMAEKIMYGGPPKGTSSRPPREGRDTTGDGDQRSHVSRSSSSFPWTAQGFLQIGCSGIMIGDSTLYTAAHCLYNTSANGWNCNDGTTSNANPICGGMGNTPKWRLGVDDTASDVSLIWCASMAIPGGYVGLAGPGGTAGARWDYGVVDFSEDQNGNACPSPTPGTDSGHLGVTWLDDAALTGATPSRYGYPGRAGTCPANADGPLGNADATYGTITQNTDCPGTGNWPGTTYQLSPNPPPAFPTAPFTGADFFGNISTAYSVLPASTNGTYVIHAPGVDWTHGDSGSALYVILPGTDRRVIGVVSNSGSPTTNYAQRYTMETDYFFMMNSQYPDDN